jgi:hypothetical protein
MTKTEFKKRLVALAIEQLENEFGVEFTGDDEGGRLGFTVAGTPLLPYTEFRGDFSRRDMEVCLWESIPLSGHGWTPAEVLAQQEAVALENQINEALEAFHMNKDSW